MMLFMIIIFYCKTRGNQHLGEPPNFNHLPMALFQTAETAETRSATANLMKVWLCGSIDTTLSSAEPYEFLVKLRNITWETNYVIVSQNALYDGKTEPPIAHH